MPGVNTAIAEVLQEISDTVTTRLKAADDQISELRERIEDTEARGRSPGRTSSPRSTEIERKHVDLVKNLLRDPRSDRSHHELASFEREHLEGKAVTTASPSGGGYAVPEVISREIERLELQFSPVRSLVKVVEAQTSDYKELVNLRGASAGWVGETDARSETATSLLRERAPTHGELYALPKTSNWALQDLLFNVEDWLAQEAAEAFALEEGEAVLRGNGVNMPTGMLNTTPVATADFASPLRAPAAYEFIASVSDNSPPSPEIQPDALIDLVYKVRSVYRAGASWGMNSSTAGAIRKLKDAEGRYIWQPSAAAGQPDTLLGYSVNIIEGMDDVGVNAFPVAFGNWRRAYTLVDRAALSLIVDNVTTPGQTKFYIRRRVGGCVTNNDALKWLRTVNA